MTRNLKTRVVTRGGTAVHVEDTTTTEKSPTSSRGLTRSRFRINVQSSRPSRTVEEILGAHPMNDSDFWGNTNSYDVSIVTTNSKEMMA